MKKQTRITLIAIITILMLLVIGGTIYGYVQKYAYADYNEIITDQNSIINFNQIAYDLTSDYYSKYVNNTTQSFGNHSITINNNGYVSTDGNYPYGLKGLTNISYVSGHKYYVSLDILSSYSGYVKLELWSNSVDIPDITTTANELLKIRQVLTCNNTISKRILLYLSQSVQNNTGITTYSNFNIIDLSACFGIGNEPNIEQANELFIADYYAYNTGSPMFINSVNAYNQGVIDTLGSTTYDVVLDDFYNNSFGLASNNSNYNTKLIKTSPYTISGQTIFGLSAYNVSWKESGESYTNNNGLLTAIGFNINNVIPVGSTLKIKYQGTSLANDYNDTSPTNIYHNVYLSTFDGNSFTRFLDLGTGLMYVSDYREFTISAPDNAESIYLIANGNINCSYLSINVEYTNSNVLIDSIYKSGQESILKLYNPGSSGYDSIFNSGKQYALTHNANNAWGSAWDFIESAFTGIGSLFTIQLLPGVPLSVFILVPLMVSLIFFIVKLVKGGE